MVTQRGSQSQHVNRSAAHKRRLSASVALLASLLLAASGQLGAHTVRAQAVSREIATSRYVGSTLSHSDALSPTMYLPVLLRQQPTASPTPTPTPTPTTTTPEPESSQSVG
ncbi:MAG: hypothetical protein K6U78_14690 [Anaerolineae bacterium]|nr:hypothetical protein [Anaerolineae bacterium]